MEFGLFSEKRYLSPILDLYSRELVSYMLSYRPVPSMVMAMLDKAFEEIPNESILFFTQTKVSITSINNSNKGSETRVCARA